MRAPPRLFDDLNLSDSEREAVEMLRGVPRLERVPGDNAAAAWEMIFAEASRHGAIGVTAAAGAATSGVAKGVGVAVVLVLGAVGGLTYDALAPAPRSELTVDIPAEVPIEPLDIPTPNAPMPKGCVAGERSCLERVAQGSTLEAQNALYRLALYAFEVERQPRTAVRTWEEYLARFPDGVLAPEASLSILYVRLESADYRKALAEAERFLSRFPKDGNRARVERIRTQLHANSRRAAEADQRAR